jgi:hypothetical protein
MIGTGLGSRVLVAFAAFRIETGKPAVRAGDATSDARSPVVVNCRQMKRPDFDFGPSPILVELKNERRMLTARSLVTDQERSTQSIRISNKVPWHTRAGRGG